MEILTPNLVFESARSRGFRRTIAEDNHNFWGGGGVVRGHAPLGIFCFRGGLSVF